MSNLPVKQTRLTQFFKAREPVAPTDTPFIPRITLTACNKSWQAAGLLEKDVEIVEGLNNVEENDSD